MSAVLESGAAARRSRWTRTLALVAACVAFAGTAGAQGAVVVRNATVIPVVGARMENASVVMQNGVITGVGANVTVPQGAQVIDATGMFVYPGLINAYTNLGLVEIGGVPGPNDTRELGDFNPQDLVATAVNAQSEHIAITRANGITSALTVAGGSTLSGIAALINLYGYTNREMLAREKTALLLSWPSNGGGGRGRGGGGGRFGGGGNNNPAQYAANVHKIYGWFHDARAYADVKARLTANGAKLPVGWNEDLRYDAMTPAIRGEMPVLVDANTEQQMMDVIHFADSMKVKVIIHGADDGWKMADTLAARKIPVIVGPMTSEPGPNDPYDEVYANPGVMAKAGVMLAFETGGASSARDLPYEVGLAEAYGLDPDEALRSITINPARMFQVDKEYGSIEVGKVGNVIVTTGDPIDIRTHIKEIFIRGQQMKFDDRHTLEYEKFRARPKPPKPPQD